MLPIRRHDEKIIRRITFNLLRKDRHFVLTSLFACFGVVCMFFLLWFGWLALLCAYFYPKPWSQELGFVLSLAVSGLPGVLITPRFECLVGFFTCTVLYAVYSVIVASDRGMDRDLIKFLFKKA